MKDIIQVWKKAKKDLRKEIKSTKNKLEILEEELKRTTICIELFRREKL